MSLTGAVLFNWLNSADKSHAVKTVPGEPPTTDVLGNKYYQYDFMLQVMLNLSKSKDSVNTNAIDYTRQWQEWIDLQEQWHNYPPEFITEYKDLRLENLTGTPFIGTGETTAEYHFFARLHYMEVPK